MISSSAAWLALVLFAGAMIHAGIKDVATMTITNRLVLVLAGAYAVLAPLAGVDVDQMLFAITAACLVLAGAFVLFALGWIGGGDAKLATVAVLWLGGDQTLPFLLYASVAGAFLTLALIHFRRLPLPVLLRQMPWTRRLHCAAAGVPYGVALAMSALILLPQSPFFALA